MTSIRRFIAFLAIALFAALAAAKADPALWLVEDEDTKIHLFGTLHLMPEGIAWMDADLKARMAVSKRLYLELTPEEMDPANAGDVVQRLGMLAPGQSLPDVLSGAAYDRLADYLRPRGMAVGGLQGMRPWLVGLLLTLQRYEELGQDSSQGVEKTIIALATEQGKDIRGLETMEQQLRLFADMPADMEEAFLIQSLDEAAELDLMADDMTAAWANGDEAALDSLIKEGFEEFPELAEAMLYRRNRAWAGQIREILKEPGTFFMAVGAGHLVGGKSVPALLREAGVTVSREP